MKIFEIKMKDLKRKKQKSFEDHFGVEGFDTITITEELGHKLIAIQ